MRTASHTLMNPVPRSRARRWDRGWAFSLIELIIVLVIIGIISAIAIPRLSRGARTAGSSALKSNLAILRKVIELYAAEHDGKYPTKMKQLVEFSNFTGLSTKVQRSPVTGEVFGPYLTKIPPMPVGIKKGATGIYFTLNAADTPPQGTANQGWWYNARTQVVRANLPNSDVDDDSVPYNRY